MFRYIPLNAKEIFLLMIEVSIVSQLYQIFEEYYIVFLILINIDGPESNNWKFYTIIHLLILTKDSD
jgi:hypothetical protein